MNNQETKKETKKEPRRIPYGLFAAVLVIVAVALVIFFACKGTNKSALTFYDPNEKVTGTASQGLVSLFIGSYKAGSTELVTYIESLPEGWDTPVDGKDGASYRQVFKDDCVLSLKNLLAAEYLHDNVYCLEITTEQQKSVDENISTLTQLYGGSEKFEAEMQKYGASGEDYERYLILMLKQSNLITYLYGEGGERQVTDDMVKSYFATNYCIAEHIFFEMRGTKKDDGTTVSFTEEQRSMIRNNAISVYNAIKEGNVSYEEAFFVFNEDLYVSSFPNGYFITNNGRYPAEFVNAAFALGVGEVAMTETTSGIHIIRKKEMDANLYNTDSEVYSYIVSVLKAQNFSELISTVIDGAKSDDELIAELDAALITPFYGFS